MSIAIPGAIILECPSAQDRQIYKVKIVAVGDRPVGGKPIVKQAALLGRVITKKARELNRDYPAFMCPPGWIEMKSEDGKLDLAVKDRDGVIDAGIHGLRKDSQSDVIKKQIHRRMDSSQQETTRTTSSAKDQSRSREGTGTLHGKVKGTRQETTKKV